MCKSANERYKKIAATAKTAQRSLFLVKRAGTELQSCIWAGSLFRHIMATSMRSRFQIILPNRQLPGTPVQSSGFWNRIKRFWAGVALATVAVAVLVAALILGSVIAVVLAIMLMIGIAVIVAKVALVRSKRTKA